MPWLKLDMQHPGSHGTNALKSLPAIFVVHLILSAILTVRHALEAGHGEQQAVQGLQLYRPPCAPRGCCSSTTPAGRTHVDPFDSAFHTALALH